MELKASDIEQVVKAVLASIGQTAPTSGAPAEHTLPAGVFAELDQAVEAARQAQTALASVALRERVIAAIRAAGETHARELAELAVAETGMGRVDDKIAKNLAQARHTPASNACKRRC